MTSQRLLPPTYIVAPSLPHFYRIQNFHGRIPIKHTECTTVFAFKIPKKPCTIHSSTRYGAARSLNISLFHKTLNFNNKKPSYLYFLMFGYEKLGFQFVRCSFVLELAIRPVSSTSNLLLMMSRN